MIEECGGPGTLTHFPNTLKQELEEKDIELSKAKPDKLKGGKKTVCENFPHCTHVEWGERYKIQQSETKHEREFCHRNKHLP